MCITTASSGVTSYAKDTGVDGSETAKKAVSDPIDEFIAAQKELLDEPDQEYWPGSRWWMSNGLHTDETIIAGVKELHDMGISVVEIVYRDGGERLPADLDTSGKYGWTSDTTPANIYAWGSEEWKHDTSLIIKEATKYGMGFSMTSGTNWSNANLPDTHLKPDDDGAGKSLGYRIQTVTGGEEFNGTLTRSSKTGREVSRQDLVAVVAMKRDPSSDGAINTAGNIAYATSDPERAMVYDDEATVVLTDRVKRDGAPVTKEKMKDPTGQADFTLNWSPPDNGTYDIYSFWIQATGQSATPSSGTNYTINYIDPYGVEALIDFYEKDFFTDDLKKIIRENGRGEIYMDSLEVSTSNGQTGQFWGYTLMDEFKKRHGYDLTRYLPYIIRTGSRAEYTQYLTKMLGNNDVKEAKIRADLYAVMTDSYVNNVLLPLKKWLNKELNMKLRAEIAFNLPYELSLSGRGVDYVEAESLDFGEQIENYRGFAGAANVYGRRLSSETGALNGQTYAHGLERYMRMVNTQFAGGIQHTVWHGYSSLSGVKPIDDKQGTPTYWPGNDMMSSNFSDRLGPRQPAFDHYDDFMTKISRDQAVLQQGKAQVDLAIMHTDYYTVHDYVGSATDVDLMRNRKANFMKDLSLQDAGYTYNFLAPENLENLEAEGIVDYDPDQGLIPENVGYQAVIVYQENMRVKSAEKLLELAEKGLPIIFVNGLNVRHMLTKGTNNWGQAIGSSSPNADTVSKALWSVSKIHEQAAAYTLGLGEDDAQLKGIVTKLKALPNVIELSPDDLPTDPHNPDPEGWGYDDKYFYNKTGILEALQDLGIRPRAEFTESNKNYFTVMRKTDDTLYLWAYNFMSDDEFKPQKVNFDLNNDINISVSEIGKPYTINTWTGEIAELGDYTIKDGRISFDLTLEPGETTVIALDLKNPGDGVHAVSTNADKALLNNGALSVYATETGTYKTVLSDGTEVVNEIQAPANISLPEWNLTVEDWTRGELVDITENRGKGYTTTESYWTTKKTPIVVGKTSLIPWKDIPAVGDKVSGIGTYTTTFKLPEDWSDANGAYLDIESLSRNTAYVWVNGQRARGLDIVAGTVDVSELLQPGVNTIKVEVSSTLRNRLIDLKYPGMNPNSNNLPGGPPPPNGGRYSIKMPPADYGMVGDTQLVTYTKALVYDSVAEKDKALLRGLIEEAEKLLVEDYTDDSWQALQVALEAAKTVVANDKSTHDAIVSAKASLQAAIDALIKIVMVVSNGNRQSNIDFEIKSANGKGYMLYISETGEADSFKKYSNVNYNSKGVHVKGLTNGKTYYAYIVYSSGEVYKKSATAVLNPSK